MLQKCLVCTIIILAVAFSQSDYIGKGDVRFAPQMLNYQGYLVDTLGIPVTNPSLSMTFTIFDASVYGNQKWTEDQVVSVNKGIFHVLLGDEVSIPDSVFANNPYRYLQLTINGQVLLPRTQIVSAGYAYIATYSDTAQYAKNIALPNFDTCYVNIQGPDSVYAVGLAFKGKGDTAGYFQGKLIVTDKASIGPGHTNTGTNAFVAGANNTASGNYATIGGGIDNIASYYYATVSGGNGNAAYSFSATVGGGYADTASADYATIGGGYANIASNSYATISGGRFNTASNQYSTVGGGYTNIANGFYAFAGGGHNNVSSGSHATLAGGYYNTANGDFTTMVGGRFNIAIGNRATVGGGEYNYNAGDWATIAGGYADTITATADYSYLYGINSNLTQDSTFMVDMPHIRFGKESGGYEFPVTDGTNGQELVTNGSGQLSWSAAGDNDWTFRITDGADTTLQTGGQWGLARAGNMLYGIYDSTHVNFGVACTTGASGENFGYCTVSGGLDNSACGDCATVGGGVSNNASGEEAAIGGGLQNSASGDYTVVSGGRENVANGWFATVSGGFLNRADSIYSFVGGGNANTASAYAASIGGGEYNTANMGFATVGGGGVNTASGYYATVGGGDENTANGDGSTIAGGSQNIASGVVSTIGGGSFNYSAGDWATIVGGFADTITATADYSYLFGINSNLTQDSTFMVDMPHIRFGKEAGGYEFPATDGTDGQALVTNGSGQLSWNAAGDNDWTFRVTDGADTTLQTGGKWGLARAGAIMYGDVDSTHVNFGVACTTGFAGQNRKYCTVSGGETNAAYGEGATVGGGQHNTAGYYHATICGGYGNTANFTNATVGGGVSNTAAGSSATVGGGDHNVAGNYLSTVSGGYGNTASGEGATVGGGTRDTTKAHFGGVFSGFCNLAGDLPTDSAAVVTGGRNNSAIAKYSFIGGGKYNTVSINYGTIGGGAGNNAYGVYSVIDGGQNNTVSNDYGTIGGGDTNLVSGSSATVAGGHNNTASGGYSAVGGGLNNVASGGATTIAGGYNNAASASYATVGGGYYDTSAAFFSFTVGNNSTVLSGYDNSTAFNGQTATASGQTRVGALSKASGTFTIDHPLDPENKILNHYFVESPDMSNIYSGSTILGANGRATILLPDYFDALNRNPRVQLTGVGSADVVYVAEDFKGNQFTIGGKPGMKVYWTVTADRKDPSAEITRIIMPVEQPKEGGLAGRSLDDEFLVTTKLQLERMGKADGFKFRRASAEKRYEEMKKMIEESTRK